MARHEDKSTNPRSLNGESSRWDQDASRHVVEPSVLFAVSYARRVIEPSRGVLKGDISVARGADAGPNAAAISKEDGMEELKTEAAKLAEEYMRLGGTRRAKIDDNIVGIRKWE